MTNEQLKKLEDNLWDAANSLRAYGGIKSADYAVPVLGLIFLKYADNKYSQHEEAINEEYEKQKGSRRERPIHEIALAKCGFYMPAHARFDYLLNLSGDKSMAKALREAMEGIEEHQDAKFQDVLPTKAYFEIEKKKSDILPQLLKALADIPKDATGDIFGKIYEFFLGKFALSEGQKGGQFFTPTSVVRFIVEVIEPYKGKIYDPACGSGGMFVQSATFVKNANQDTKDIYVCGQEFMGETVRLAKMNLMVNNLRGEIAEVNSYQDNPFDSYGKFDFVMANPPFNVKSVKKTTVDSDDRFKEYGLPVSKGKDAKISDANYLWVSLFATSLNENGRAGFVMPNGASDAKGTQYDIRKSIVDSGIVDCMVSMPSNMFLTVTLPATLWFFDKKKTRTDRKDKILFLDARNVYNQIDRAHREWTPEQQKNLATIVRLYRGENKRYLELIQSYLKEAEVAISKVEPSRNALIEAQDYIIKELQEYASTNQDKLTAGKRKKLVEADFFTKLQNWSRTKAEQVKSTLTLTHSLSDTALENQVQLKAGEHLNAQVQQEGYNHEALKADNNLLLELLQLADKNLRQKNDKAWDLTRQDKALEEAMSQYSEAKSKADYWNENIQWLQKRFPKGKYNDVIGLCKVSDSKEFGEEQDYSLNAGRYVGVELEDDNISKEEFTQRLSSKRDLLFELNSNAVRLEELIVDSINNLINQ